MVSQFFPSGAIGKTDTLAGMELRHLRYFDAVADTGSFTAAARRLHISQSAVSEQVAALEEEIGGPLLDRSGRRVRLTSLGQVFLGEAQKTLAAAQRAVEQTQRSLRGEAGTLTIGFFLWGAGGFFPRLIREYRRRRPGIRLSLHEMHASEQAVALEEGRCCRFAPRTVFSPQIANTCATWSGVLTLVEAGEGIALVPMGVRHLRSKGLSFSRLSPDVLSLGMAVAWHPRNEDPALIEFLRLVRENRERIQRSGGN